MKDTHFSIPLHYSNFCMNLLCSIRVGNELGAGHPNVARFSVFVVITASVAFSILATILVLVLRYPLSTLYTSSTTVIEAVIKLTPLLSISIFLNGIQPILSGAFHIAQTLRISHFSAAK